MDVEFLTPALHAAGPCDDDAGNAHNKQTRRVWGVCVGVRHVQLLYMAASAAAAGCLRAATAAGASALLLHAAAGNSTAAGGHPAGGYDTTAHGALMSLYLAGHALAVLPVAAALPPHGGGGGGRPTALLAGALTGAAGVALLMPVLLVREWWWWCYAAMAVGGMVQVVPGAALVMLLHRWMPRGEARTAHHAVFLCMEVGTAAGWAGSGNVVGAWWLHWRGVWYVAGGAAVVMAVCVCALTADGPDAHPAAGDTERDYIRDTHAQAVPPRSRWYSLLTSCAMLGALCARAAPMAVCAILNSYGVLYLQRAGYTLEQSMYVMCVGALCHLVVGGVYGRCVRRGGRAYGSDRWHRDTYRTIVTNGVGCVLSVSLLAALSLPHPLHGVRAAVGVAGLMAVQGIVQHNELEYLRESFGSAAGRALTLSVSLSGTVTAAAPIAAAMLLGDHMDSVGGWRCVCLSLAALQVASSVTISVLGTRHEPPTAQRNDSGIVYRPCTTNTDKNLLPLEEYNSTNSEINKQLLLY